MWWAGQGEIFSVPHAENGSKDSKSELLSKDHPIVSLTLLISNFITRYIAHHLQYCCLLDTENPASRLFHGPFHPVAWAVRGRLLAKVACLFTINSQLFKNV
jgi:hypothetical protein